MAKTRLVLILLCAGCLVSWITARPQLPDSKQKPAVRVTTRLVEVNVVVQDKKGESVSDLTRDDFEVAEQGKAQTIASFALESNLNPIGRPASLPPNTFSNAPAQKGASQNLAVVLFDTLNTPIADQASAKRALMTFLKQIQPQDRVAIYGLGTSLKVIHDFTGDSEALARAIAHYSNSLSIEQAGSIAPVEDHSWLAENAAEAGIIAAIDEVFNAAGQRVAGYYIEDRTKATLQALEAIAGHLASVPGRKCLIWLSAGFPFMYGSTIMLPNQLNQGVKSFSDMVSRTARSITNADVAIYPVDARGLIGPMRTSPSSRPSVTTESARQAARIDDDAMDEVAAAHGTMQELADQTGGRASYNTNDVQRAIRQALEDSRATYALGYYPSDTNFDGKFRSIKVSIKRPGLQLKYRRGYFAFPDEPLDDTHRRNALSSAATRMLEATGIVFSVEVNRPPAGGAARQLVMDVDTASIRFEPSKGTWTGGLDVMLVQFDANGKELKSGGREVPLVLTQADHEQLLQNGLVLNLPVQLLQNCDRLRVILRDTKAGAIGSVTVLLADVR